MSALQQVQWMDDGRYLHLQVSISVAQSAAAAPSWSVSFPKSGGPFTRVHCRGTSEDCLVSRASPCNLGPGTDPASRPCNPHLIPRSLLHGRPTRIYCMHAHLSQIDAIGHQLAAATELPSSIVVHVVMTTRVPPLEDDRAMPRCHLVDDLMVLMWHARILPGASQKVLPAAAAGQISVQSVSGGSCPAGQASPDQLNGAQLLYGLKVLPAALPATQKTIITQSPEQRQQLSFQQITD